MRLAVVASHPIQYYAPLFRELARRVDLQVFFAHRASPEQQARAGFGTAFEWDVDLLSGYPYSFLTNIAQKPEIDHFNGCDTPEIGARLRKGGFDALLVMGWHLKAFLQGVWAAKRLGLPVMVRGDSHLATPRSSLKRAAKALAYPIFLRVFDAALYVGERSRRYYEYYGYPSERLFFSPHCVDTEWFAARATAEAGRALRADLDIPPAAQVVLFAGKLLPFKHPADVVEAVSRLRSQSADVRAIIAGSGELAETLRARGAETSTPIHMLGFVNQTGMPAVYAAADVLVLPSDGRETWGLVCNEAHACGTPIVVSEAVGCAPDLAVGPVGRVFPPGNVSALAQALREMLSATPPVEFLAAKSRAYALSVAADGIEAGAGAAMRRAWPRTRPSAFDPAYARAKKQTHP